LTLPVLVLDEGDRGDLGLVRSLGLARIPVRLLTHLPRGTTAASRYVTSVHAFPPPAAAPAQRIDALCAIARETGDRPPVMMAGDRSLMLVSDHRETLEGVVRFDIPAASVVETCYYKDRFAIESMRLGLPVPHSSVAASVEDVRRSAGGLRFPVFVKPITKDLWDRDRLPPGVVEGQKGQRVDRADDLVALFERLRPHGADSAIIQQLVSSPDSEHYSVHAYVTPDGTFAGAFTTRKIRVEPPGRGIGSCVKSELVTELVDMSRDVLRKLSYTGFALLQYKRDISNGQLLLLEINCRFSTSGELPARCGSNFPAVSYAALMQRSLPPVSQRAGPCWIDLEADLGAMREYRRLGEWTWPSYVASLVSVRYPAYLAFDDPRPFTRRVAARVRRRLQSRRRTSARS
jgi:predicted ATP-grasp superfamily ATP-dependent carboligase